MQVEGWIPRREMSLQHPVLEPCQLPRYPALWAETIRCRSWPGLVALVVVPPHTFPVTVQSAFRTNHMPFRRTDNTGTWCNTYHLVLHSGRLVAAPLLFSQCGGFRGILSSTNLVSQDDGPSVWVVGAPTRWNASLKILVTTAFLVTPRE